MKLKKEDGNWVEHLNRVRKLIDDYFLNLFTFAGRREWGPILECVTPSVATSMNESLMSSISDVEIKEATLQMGSLKAPGPDGFHGVFYHSFWESIREEVNALVWMLEFGEVNPADSTQLTLCLFRKFKIQNMFPSSD